MSDTSYELLKNLSNALGPARLMCSGILEGGADCDEQATHKIYIGQCEADKDAWVGGCPACAARALVRQRRVENLE